MTNPDNAGGLPELPGCAGAFHVQLFRDCPSMRNVEFSETSDFGQGTHPLYTADQMRAYGELCRAAPAGGDENVAKPLMAARETEDDGAAIMGRLARALAKADPSSKLPRTAIDWLRGQGIHWRSHCPTDPAHDFGEPISDNKSVNQLRAIRRRFDYSGTREDAERCAALDAAIDALIAPAVSATREGSCEPPTPYKEVVREMNRLADKVDHQDRVIAKLLRATREGDGEVPTMLDRIAADLTDEGEHAPSVEQLAGEIRNAAALLRKLQQGADYVVVPREALRVEARRLRYRATETCGLDPKTTDAGAQMVHTAEALEQFASQDQEGGKCLGVVLEGEEEENFHGY